ncbi:MAG: AsmA-like C-terminal region-containing protein, partial [Candidatus Gastranaerophilales bacterium]|nr:AsmA-like C-terminal region-containing protein [Candidatus Gastranaerophilales bacterium]
GEIDSNSTANINVIANKIPLAGLYLAFAPGEIKNAYDLKSGFLTFKTNVTGEIKDITALCKADLEDFILTDRAGNFVIINKLARFGILNDSGDVRGRFKNKGFRIEIPGTKSVLADDLLVADIDNKNIIINDSDIRLNRNSVLTFNGKLSNYISNPQLKAYMKGNLADSDLKKLAGEAAAPYLDSRGSVPVKAELETKGDKIKAVIQMLSSADSYITPVKIDEFIGKQLLVQLLVEKSGDVVKIYKSGLYLRKPNAQFRDNLALNLLNAREVVKFRAMVSNLNTKPFVNLFKITVKDDLNGSICVFPQSKFIFGGKLHLFGYFNALKIDGRFYVRNLRIPELMTTVRDITANLGTRDVRVDIRDVLSNGSDFNINILSNWNLLSHSRLAEVRVNSRLIDVDKLMKVSEAAMKILPAGNASPVPADIPVEILRGNINLRRVISGNIIANNTTGRISLFRNVLYINNLRTLPMGGNVIGDISMNLISTELNAKLSGKNFDIEKILLDVMEMKDTLSGNLDFIADISLKGITMEEQMKTLKGYADFNVRNGQLGPFGKFENFLMAENIRENAFFSSTIGSIITNIVTIDTSHFNSLFGHLTFKDGFADVAPIKSQGDVMSMYIAGKVGLIDNSADLKLRGKLASAFSDHLGPLANINPVNLIKNTPGLNVVAAKTFSVFCESLSEDEMNAIPELDERKSDDYATKFQIVLHGDTRKPLKMIKSFKWLALDSEIENAQNFVDTIPMPEAGEENLSVEELINIRTEQASSIAQPPV